MRVDYNPFEYNSEPLRNTIHGIFLGFRCGVPPATDSNGQRRFGMPSARNGPPLQDGPYGCRCTTAPQTDNDASGNPQRVAGAPRGRSYRCGITYHDPRFVKNAPTGARMALLIGELSAKLTERLSQICRERPKPQIQFAVWKGRNEHRG